MRISDWSSDVCSSDLDGRPASRVRRQGAVAGGEHNFGLMPPSRSLADASNVHRLHDHWIQRAMSLSSVTAFLLLSGATPPTVAVPAETQPQTDRKRVVSRQSVSERVDIVGSRIIKKKKKKT